MENNPVNVETWELTEPLMTVFLEEVKHSLRPIDFKYKLYVNLSI